MEGAPRERHVAFYLQPVPAVLAAAGRDRGRAWRGGGGVEEGPWSAGGGTGEAGGGDVKIGSILSEDVDTSRQERGGKK